MKKLYSTIALMSLLLFTGLCLTSCVIDEDQNVGYTLQGHWFGDLDMYYDGVPARGSDIIFYPEGYGYRKGTGTQIDYYGRYGYTQIRHDFSYYVENGVIYLTFYDEPDLDCSISRYGLNADNFWGRIDGRYSSTDFRLRNYDRYWESEGYYAYDYDYDHRYYGGYYTKQALDIDTLNSFAATRAAAPQDSATPQDTISSQPKGTRGVNNRG
ncbi:MAG: hypothetical protein IJ767_06540 [Bacteroidaceae bacterium]|nr:hypothetical protein [Bacteroidaceae bacterium]